jgi:hypothetical protein
MVVKVITFIQFIHLRRLTNMLVMEKFHLAPRLESSLLQGVEKQKMVSPLQLSFLVKTPDMAMFAKLVGAIVATAQGRVSGSALKH